MRILGLLIKLWLALSVLAGIAVGIAFFSGHDGVTVRFADDVLDGSVAALVFGLTAAVLIFLGGMLVSVLVVVLGIVIPCAVILGCVALLMGLGAAGVAVLGSFLVMAAPLLIVVAACVLLVRVRRRRSVTAAVAL